QLREEKELEAVLAGLLQDDRLDFFVEQGYVTQIKGGKNDSEISKLRLTKKGNTLLSDCQIPEILEEDLTVFEWLKNMYLSSDKEVGNAKKTKFLIALFRVHSGISKNKL